MPTRQGSFRLFQLFGITVYLHWSWFLVAIIRYQMHSQWHQYESPIWYVLEYVTLFLIVLIHEFGHQLACRSVGGKTHDIVLWPLGGVAYVSPPQRPGAQLWSIAAGPLVNVALLPILSMVWDLGYHAGWEDSMPDLYTYVWTMWLINLILLIFNMLPIYPLDGGQILRSLLWFILGRANSLMIATVIGFIGVAGLIGYAILIKSVWMGIMTVFILMNCWGGLRQAQALMKIAKAPRRDGFRCPECQTQPPMGDFWRCGKCQQPFDIFETHAICPHCQAQYTVTSCPECGSQHPITAWESFGQAPPKV
jgi:Zn-dependent protease